MIKFLAARTDCLDEIKILRMLLKEGAYLDADASLNNRCDMRHFGEAISYLLVAPPNDVWLLM